MLEFKSVKATNLYSFEDLYIEYQQGLTLVTGKNLDSTNASSNYSGKSSALVEIPLWVLYEKGTREVSPAGTITANYTKESVIRNGIDKCWGEVRFIKDGEEYAIERSRDIKGNSKLFLKKYDNSNNPITIAGKDKLATQKIINDLVGEYNIFTQIVFFAQGTKRFTEARDSERKAVLESLLDLSDYSLALKLTKEKILNKKKEEEALKRNISSSELIILERNKRKVDANNSYKAQMEEYKNWEAERNEEVNRAKNTLNDIDDDIASSVMKQQDLEAELAIFVNGGRDSLVKEKLKLEKETNFLQKEIVKNTTEKGIDAKKITKLRNLDKCPECLQEVSKKHKSTMLKELEEKTIHKEKIVEAMENSFILKKAEYEAIVSELEVYTEKEKELEALKKERDRLERDWATQTNHIESIESKEKKKPNKEVLDAITKEILKEKAEKLKTEKELIKTLQEIEDLEFWGEAFGNGGIKSLLFDSVLPILNKKANEYASILVGEPIDLEFDTESVLKSGAIRDKFDVRVKTDGGEGYHLCSGGQRSRINFAVALALQSLQASRGSRANLFICDEPFESVDSGGQDGIIELLDDFAKENNLNIYIITHLENLKVRFTNALEITKQKGISKLA